MTYAVLRCQVKVMPDDLANVVLTIEKDGKLLQRRTGVASIEGTPPLYTLTYQRALVSRTKDEGLYACRVTSNKDNRQDEKSVLLHIVERLSEQNRYLTRLDNADKCILKYTEETPYSNPPMQAKCGIWAYETPSDATRGSWLPNQFGMKAFYSTEDGEWKVKPNPKLPKMKSHVLTNMVFKKRDLPKDKMMELRCEHFYRFGQDATSVVFTVDTERTKLMESFSHRCPSLEIYRRKIGDYGNVTTNFGPSFYNKRTNSELHNDYTTDCMGMWSSMNDSLEATVTCDSKNATEGGANEKETVHIICKDGQWVKKHDPLSFDIENFHQECISAGSGAVSHLYSCVLLVASCFMVLSVHFSS